MSGAAVWFLWAVLYSRGTYHVRQSNVYDTRAECEHTARVLNTIAPETGVYVCFLQRVTQ